MVDITRRSDYACRILRAAYYAGGTHISVNDIAKEEDIPYAFARSIQHDLVKKGLVKAARGAHGGLILNCDPAEVTLLEVLEAVQGPVSIAVCAADPEFCAKSPECDYHQVWKGADQLLQGYFSTITLDDMFKLGRAHPSIKHFAAMQSDAQKEDGGKAVSDSSQAD